MSTLELPSASSGEASAAPAQRIDADRITELAIKLEGRLDVAIESIRDLNDQTKMLSLNARMEAARAGGETGAAFNAVAIAIREVSNQMVVVAHRLADDSRAACTELRLVNSELATRVKGERLSDLALMNIDVIDRNLYERSCDCRWWATDASVVELLLTRSAEAQQFCSRRLRQILDSYTVYFDIVVADASGTIVANGNTQEYASVGSSQADARWFTEALRSRDGTVFGFETVHNSRLVNSERALAYSCTVRMGGDVHGRTLGVLCVLFRWDALAQTIVCKTPLAEHERKHTRVCIIDSQGTILADTAEKFLTRFDLAEYGPLLAEPKNYSVIDRREERQIIGHAQAPGFETYTTGWHSLIIQTTKTMGATNKRP